MRGRSHLLFFISFSSVLIICLFLVRVGFIFAQTTNNLSVTATVPAQATDFQADISSSTTGEPLPQDTTIDYQINYGSYLSNNSGFTLEAQWDLGTLENSSTPTVDGLNYVIGSSTDGYGSISPVIDTVNKKITWTFTNFPANTTNRTVSFQLKTNGSYTGATIVTFPVKTRILGPGVTTSYTTVSKTYQYVSTITPTPTSTPTPTPGQSIASTTTTPTPTLTPTPVSPTKLTIDDIFVREISQNQASIAITTSEKTKLFISYGTATNNLTQSVQTPSYQLRNEIVLDNLDQTTHYYFKVVATNESGRIVRSDIFTFVTAQLSDKPQINPNSIVFVSGNVVLYSSSTLEQVKPFIVIPQNMSYTFNFSLEKKQLIKKVQAIMRDKYILGIKEVQAAEPNSQLIELLLLNNNTYQGRLKTPDRIGSYELFIRIEDINGNITESKIGEIHTSNRLTVFSKSSKTPIESAKITMYLLNQTTHTYQFISPQQVSITNPDYTDLNGQIGYPLFTGNFKAHISALGYKDKDILFTLGEQSNELFPMVYLEDAPFSYTTLFTHYYSTFSDVSSTVHENLISLTQSNRFFQLNGVVILIILVGLCFIAFKARIQIPLRSFPAYFSTRFHQLFSRQSYKKKIAHFLVNSNSQQPLARVKVYLIDNHTQKIIGQTITDKKGFFSFAVLPFKTYNLQLMIEGSKPFIINKTLLPNNEEQIELLEVQLHEFTNDLRTELAFLFERVFSILFELFLLLSFIFELLFIYVFQWQRVFPFVLISLINLVFWIFHEVDLQMRNKVVE